MSSKEDIANLEVSQHVGSCKGGNTIPRDPDGRVYHFGCCEGEVANEVLLVSCYQLAEDISKLFDEVTFVRKSNRGYHTYTGIFRGKRLSVVGFGIGFAMIDFLLRELRAITSGPLHFIQLGCAPSPCVELGKAIVCKDAVAYELDLENFAKLDCPYRFFGKPVPADAELVSKIEAALTAAGIAHQEGRIISNPSFCAGVAAPTVESGGLGSFNFKTEGLMDKIAEHCGHIDSFEMDTYPLLWTSLRATEKNIHSAAVTISGSDLSGHVLSEDRIKELELQIAPVLLEQLGSYQ